MIAAMGGHATGGGLALGFCADVVIIARESRYGCSFMNMGLTPGMGTTRLLEHCLSPAIARELLFTGEFRRGSAFKEGCGFNYVLPKAQVLPKAMDVAARMAEKPRKALETLKLGLAQHRRQIFEEAFALETAMHRATLAQPEIRRMIEDEYAE
jgi:polyketide biosynthesis enoyl-CoA hydratase PksI